MDQTTIGYADGGFFIWQDDRLYTIKIGCYIMEITKVRE